MAAGRTESTGRVRVIGGRWRGRKLDFRAVAGLRPTADRVRERLFNWLQGELYGARCLDLYAGSGALGIEAVSRGAEHATLIDSNPKVAQGLKSMTAALMQGEDSGRFDVQCGDALDWLEQSGARCDIAFLDPPFDNPVSARLITALDARVQAGAWVYHEHRTGDAQTALPEHWHLHRSGRAGEATYALYQIQSNSHE